MYVVAVGDGYGLLPKQTVALVSGEGCGVGEAPAVALQLVETLLVFGAGEDEVDERAALVGLPVGVEPHAVGGLRHGPQVRGDVGVEGKLGTELVAEDLLRGGHLVGVGQARVERKPLRLEVDGLSPSSRREKESEKANAQEAAVHRVGQALLRDWTASKVQNRRRTRNRGRVGAIIRSGVLRPIGALPPPTRTVARTAWARGGGGVGEGARRRNALNQVRISPQHRAANARAAAFPERVVTDPCTGR